MLVDLVKIVGDATSQGSGDVTNRQVCPKKIQASIRRWYDLARNYFEEPDAVCQNENPWQELFWRAVCRIAVCRIDLPSSWMETTRIMRFEEFRDADFNNSDDLDSQYGSDSYDTLNFNAIDQCFYITEKGYMGTGPPRMAVGDEVWILCGGKVPFVLREVEAAYSLSDLIVPVVFREGMCYHQLLGDGFVYGIMDGEAVERPDTELRQVNIV